MKELLFPTQILAKIVSRFDWFESPRHRFFKQMAASTNGEFLKAPDIVDAFYRQRRAVIVYKRVARGRYKVVERLQFSIWLHQRPKFAFALYGWPGQELTADAPLSARFHALYNCYGKPHEPVTAFFTNPTHQNRLVSLPVEGPMRIILEGKQLTLHKYYERHDTVENALIYLDCLSDLADALET